MSTSGNLISKIATRNVQAYTRHTWVLSDGANLSVPHPPANVSKEKIVTVVLSEALN